MRVPGLPRFAVEDVHRFLGLLAGLFIAIHVGSIALDTVVPFSLSQLVIPFTSGYRPLATGLGVVAVELLLAVAVTNRLRSRLPYKVWRRAHYATLAVWLLATVHGILSGTDRSQTWLLAVYATTVALVAGAAVLRFGRAPTPRRVATGLAVAAGAGIVVLGLSALPQQAPASKTSDQRRRHDDDRPRSQRHPDRDDRPQRRLEHRLDQWHRRVAVGVPDRPPHRRRRRLRHRSPAAVPERHDLRGHAECARQQRLHRHVHAAGWRHPHGDLHLDGLERHRRRHDLDVGRQLDVGRRLNPSTAPQ